MSQVAEQPGVQREIHTEAAMLRFGDMLAKALVPGSVVYLEGDLGVGKTTLCRGIIAGLGSGRAGIHGLPGLFRCHRDLSGGMAGAG